MYCFGKKKTFNTNLGGSMTNCDLHDRNSTKIFKNAGMREIYNGGLRRCRSHLRSKGSTVSSPGDKLYLFLMNYSSFNLHSTVKK